MKKNLSLFFILFYCFAFIFSFSWDFQDQVLTISGEGDIPDYNYGQAPWYTYKNQISSVIISEGITSIGDNSFDSCYYITNIEIPSTVTSIKGSLYEFKNTKVNENNPRYGSFNGALYDKKSKKLLRVSPYTEGVFSIPNNIITDIEDYAFSNCSKLTSIIIPDSMKNLEADIFYGCSNLIDISVGENNSNYASLNGILYDKSIKHLIYLPEGIEGSISIPEGVISIDNKAFSGCYNLLSVTIPDSVISIGEMAFSYDKNLTNINISDSSKLTSIGGFAFNKCNNLKTITIPSSVTSIGDSAFMECKSLNSITIPDTTKEFSTYVFNKCTNLKKITLPKGITKIEDGTFSDCESLTDIIIPDSVTEIGTYAFDGCKSLKKITLPKGITKIEGSSFSDCESLTDIIIPDGVTFIDNHAFSDSSLNTITLPDSITSIGEYAFDDCSPSFSVIASDKIIKEFNLPKKIIDKWQYNIVKLHKEDRDEINKLGEQGWDLVNILPDSNQDYVIAYFKKKI